MATPRHHPAPNLAVRLMSVGELADYLGKPAGWIYDAVSDGRLPAIRVGRAVRFDPVEIATWLDANRTGTRS